MECVPEPMARWRSYSAGSAAGFGASTGRALVGLSHGAQLCVSSAGQEGPAKEAPVPTKMGWEKCQMWDNCDGDTVHLCMCHGGGDAGSLVTT